MDTSTWEDIHSRGPEKPDGHRVTSERFLLLTAGPTLPPPRVAVLESNCANFEARAAGHDRVCADRIMETIRRDQPRRARARTGGMRQGVPGAGGVPPRAPDACEPPAEYQPRTAAMLKSLRGLLGELAARSGHREDREDFAQDTIMATNGWDQRQQAHGHYPSDDEFQRVAVTTLHHKLGQRADKLAMIRGVLPDDQPSRLVFRVAEGARLKALSFQVATTVDRGRAGGVVVFPEGGDETRWHGVALEPAPRGDRIAPGRYRARYAPPGDAKLGSYLIRWRAVYEDRPEAITTRRFDVTTAEAKPFWPKGPMEPSPDFASNEDSEPFQRHALLPILRTIADLARKQALVSLSDFIGLSVPLQARWLRSTEGAILQARADARQQIRQRVAEYWECREDETFIALDWVFRELAQAAMDTECGITPPDAPAGSPADHPHGSGSGALAEARTSLFGLVIETAIARGITVPAYVVDAARAGSLPEDAEALVLRQVSAPQQPPAETILVRLFTRVKKVLVRTRKLPGYAEAPSTAFVGAYSSSEVPPDAKDDETILLSLPAVQAEAFQLRVRSSTELPSRVEIGLARAPASLSKIVLRDLDGSPVGDLDLDALRRGERVPASLHVEQGTYLLEAHRAAAPCSRWQLEVHEDAPPDAL